jgi:hypothetical protein
MLVAVHRVTTDSLVFVVSGIERGVAGPFRVADVTQIDPRSALGTGGSAWLVPVSCRVPLIGACG